MEWNSVSIFHSAPVVILKNEEKTNPFISRSLLLLSKNVTISELYDLYLQYPSVETDTRKLKKNDLFFALKGPNFNGNHFAVDALKEGAAYAIVDEEILPRHESIIQVEDVLATLQALARHHRNQFDIPFLAITGSNGKTTTKELIHRVLSSQYKTYTTTGNLNNHIGIPLTILKIKKDAEIAVIEMGANHPKEIESYCRYTLPTHGIITNCGKAHLEGFGSIEGVRRSKGELFDFLRATKGTVFAYDDYDYLHEMTSGIEKTIWYGTKTGFISGNAIASDPFLKIELDFGNGKEEIETNLVGNYNLPNVLCAAAVGKYFSIATSKIKDAIEEYNPSNSRSQLIQDGTNKIILDAYNANPSSMAVAIENFAQMQAEKKVVILGAMMELGAGSDIEHQQIVDQLSAKNWFEVALVGGDFKNTHGRYHFFPSVEKAASWYEKQDFENCYILIKGSRSMKMEKILQKEG